VNKTNIPQGIKTIAKKKKKKKNTQSVCLIRGKDFFKNDPQVGWLSWWKPGTLSPPHGLKFETQVQQAFLNSRLQIILMFCFSQNVDLGIGDVGVLANLGGDGGAEL
jgi:hypothetical protein